MEIFEFLCIVQMIFGIEQNKYAIEISSVYNRFKFGWTSIYLLIPISDYL